MRTFVSLDVNHAANNARKGDWVVEGHERVESTVCIPLWPIMVRE